MNWSDVADVVGKVAPGVGAALGGPAGAAIGSAVSSVLGVSSTPEAVSQAVSQDPDALIKLRALDADIRQAQIKADTDRQIAVNETMRAELQSQGWFKTSWRAAIGWTMALVMFMVAATMCVTMVREPSQADAVIGGMMTLIIAMSGVLGVNIVGDSKEWRTGVLGKRPSSFMDSVVKKPR